MIKSSMLLGQIWCQFFSTTAERSQTLELFSVAVENKQLLFLNVSGMHHHKDTSIMFQRSACMCVCWSANTLSSPPPCCCWLIVTAPESAACLHYSHTHLALLAPPQHLDPENRGGNFSCPRGWIRGCFIQPHVQLLQEQSWNDTNPSVDYLKNDFQILR